MFKFDYFRINNNKFNPLTPTSALKAYEAGILPIEVFVYRATSIKPIDEEPFDITAIERLVARKNLDINLCLIIMNILRKLIKRKEPETAQFAAESINSIENRYNKNIESIKKKLKKAETEELLFELSNLYYELSLLNSTTKAIRNFYLKEAYTYINEIKFNNKTDLKVYKLLIYILCDLKLYDQALHLLHKGEKSGLKDKYCDRLLIEAEICFRKNDFNRIFEIISELRKNEDQLSEKEKHLVSFWLEHK